MHQKRNLFITDHGDNRQTTDIKVYKALFNGKLSIAVHWG